MKLAGNSTKNTVSWKRIDDDEGSRPSPRYSFSMCYLYDSKQCLIFGGKNDQGKPFDDKVYSLQVVDNTHHSVKAKWRSIETSGFSGCIAGHQCVCVGNLMFLFGGQDSNGKYNDELYQMEISGQWSKVKTKGHQPSSRICHSMASIEKRIYIFGGIDENGQSLNDLYVFDVNLSTWSAISMDCSIPGAIHGLALLGMRNTNDDGDLLCLVLGANKDSPVNNICTYGSKSNSWSSRPIRGDLQKGRSYFMSSLLMAGQIFLFGGTGFSGVHNDCYIYNVLSSSWTKLHENDGIAPPPRSNTGGFRLGLDKVVVFGGLDNCKGSLNDLWLARLHK